MIGYITKAVVGGVTSFSASKVTSSVVGLVLEVPKDKVAKAVYSIGIASIGTTVGYIVGSQAEALVDDISTTVVGVKEHFKARKEAKELQEVEED